MKSVSRESKWTATPYFPDAVCDICLSTHDVKIGLIKVITRKGLPMPGRIRLWSLCDSCHRLGSGLVIDVSVEGLLVYLCVRVVDGDIRQQFVFAPLMFREDSF